VSRVAVGVSGVSAGAGRLAGPALLVRCLARSAPALTDALAALWAAARRAVLGAPPLALRKG
jgi:hypothetical protein